MSEYIEREAVIEIILGLTIVGPDVAQYANAVCYILNLETHECENELLSTDHEGGASYSLNFYDDDFCSYGERREIDHD